MKRLTVQTNDKVIIEHHSNSAACFDRIRSLRKRYTVVSIDIVNIVKPIETKGLYQATKMSYVEIKG